MNKQQIARCLVLNDVLNDMGIEIRQGLDSLLLSNQWKNMEHFEFNKYIRALFEYTEWPKLVDKLVVNDRTGQLDYWWTAQNGETQQMTLDAWVYDVNWYLDFYQ